MKAIRGGTVYTMAGPPIENGTVLIPNGKITAVGGPELPVPAGAQCIDAAGCWVTPGFIDAHSHLALWGEPEMKATSDENEMTDPITPHLVTASTPMTLQYPRFGPPDSRRSTPDPVRAM